MDLLKKIGGTWDVPTQNKPLLYKKLLRDLFAVAIAKKYTAWVQVSDYARNHVKYDNLTFRDLDKVHQAIINHH